MMRNKRFFGWLLATCMLMLPATMQAANTKPGTFTTGDKTFLLNGEPFIVKAAEVHYPRIPRPYWEHRIKMCKALGMNTLCLYVFWNIHEQREGAIPWPTPSHVCMRRMTVPIPTTTWVALRQTIRFTVSRTCASMPVPTVTGQTVSN